MSWFSKLIHPDTAKSKAPKGLWFKCPRCSEVILNKTLDEHFKVCPNCNKHFKLRASERISQLLDGGSFKELFSNITSVDTLNFTDSKKYADRIIASTNKTKQNSAVITGTGRIEGNRIAIGVMDFAFMGGSMGSVVGEKISLILEYATENKLPAILITASGGARMQEGIMSLMQMAKTSAAIAKHHEAGLLSITILTDPTTGGTTASFATLSDILLAEPETLICFAGPRVIEQTIRQKLPAGFQKAEYLLEHGMLDNVVHRNSLKSYTGSLITHLTS